MLNHINTFHFLVRVIPVFCTICCIHEHALYDVKCKIALEGCIEIIKSLILLHYFFLIGFPGK